MNGYSGPDTASPHPVTPESPQAFSQRLHEIAARNGVPTGSTAFALWFSQQAPELRVTRCAVRKWLCAEAIPSQARMVRLALLLGVDPAWLRFGPATEHPQEEQPAPVPLQQLVQTSRHLPARDQQLLLDLARAMLDRPFLPYGIPLPPTAPPA